MRLHHLGCLIGALLALNYPLAMAAADSPDTGYDPYLWLEDVQGDKALAWVRERNAASRKLLQAHPLFTATRDQLLAILDSRDRIPQVVRHGDWLYNFWRDDVHPRGVWRRTSLAEFRQAEPAWDTLLDLDALAASENENWVWGGAQCLGPDYRRCLLQMSRGGADAKVVREFDLAGRRFVADGGFNLGEAKSDVEWIDRDTVYIGTDFGPGSMTESGYPRIIKRWQRGQPLSQAVTMFEVDAKDVYAYVSVDLTPGYQRTVFGRGIDFYRVTQSLLQDGSLVPIAKPDDAQASFWRDHLLLKLRSDWPVGARTYRAGSLLLAGARAYLAGQRDFTVLFEPSATRSLAGYATTRSQVLLNVLDNVAGRLEEWRKADSGWVRREIKAPFPGTLSVAALHDPMLARDPLAERYLVSYADFLTPDSLLLGRTGTDAREALKARKAFFDSRGQKVDQFFATSKDGTRVPYFVVWPRGATADGDNPTVLYGYGGFQVSSQPWYSAGFGTAWYSRGGALVVANIRGGGEYGPTWHQAAIKSNKQASYDDFIAVAEDLIARRITSPKRLAIQGGSNGGLLVGAVMLQRPELFGAVVCHVPLLDMRRYHKLLAGASWVAEYGDPDKAEEWAWISKYSPYQNVRPDMKLPKVLLATSTRDDRVHPGHARKMVARMAEQGHDVLYYENIEGGHGGAADNAQLADLLALEFSFLWQTVGR